MNVKDDDKEQMLMKGNQVKEEYDEDDSNIQPDQKMDFGRASKSSINISDQHDHGEQKMGTFSGPGAGDGHNLSSVPDTPSQTDFSVNLARSKHNTILQDARKNMNMNPRHSLKIYPRVDQGYKAKKSLNFDMMRSAVFIARGDPDKAKFWRWVCYILIGFLTGIIAFLMEQLEEYMVEWRNDIVSIIIEKYATNHTIAQLLAWVFLSAWCFTIGGAASYMTIRFGPGANGSGIAELIAYLNGVNIPMLIGWDTFIIKSLCVVLGIGANLCIGKEGPLAHIGANVAVLLVYSVPLNVFQYYQNDVMKREFVAAGISAGVSAAFGSPIGGTLFAYELSKPSTFWTFSMLWRTFLCAAFATYTLSLLGHVAEKGWTDLELTAAGTLKFGSLQNVKQPIQNIPDCIVLGIVGGVLGSFFINTNTWMSTIRKKYITTTTKRVIETGMFGMMTMTACVVSIVFLENNCVEPNPGTTTEKDFLKDDNGAHDVDNFQQWICTHVDGDPKRKYYNPLASLFFNTEGNSIKTLFSKQEVFTYTPAQLAIFSIVWYMFTITTYGVWVPAGLFLPGIIMGGTIGRLYSSFIQYISGYGTGIIGLDDHQKDLWQGRAQQCALLGATSMLMGYCRLTFSLAVVMMETSQAINMYLPMLICMLFSYGSALLFNQSLYNRALRSKQVPYLKSGVPSINEGLMAKIVMKPKPVALVVVPSVYQCSEALKSGHNTFPIVNRSGQLVGQIPSSFLVVLIQRKQWYSRSLNANFVTQIHKFDYGPLYNQQLSFDQDATLKHAGLLYNTLDPTSPSSPLPAGHSLGPKERKSAAFARITGNTDSDNTQSEEQQQQIKQQEPIIASGLSAQLANYNYERTPSMALFGKYQVMEDKDKVDQDMTTLNKHKQRLNRDRSMNDFLQNETKNLMKRVSRVERRASEIDSHDLPLAEVIVDWHHFNQDMASKDKPYDKILDTAAQNPKERIDLRPYMIEQPIICFTTDKLQKVLDIYRFNQCRQLCVINPCNGRLQGVIGREDLFAYMSL